MAAPTLALPAAGRTQSRTTGLYATAAVIVAGVMFVATLIAVFEALSFRAHVPPQGVHLDEYLGVISSLTLLLSAVTMAWAVAALRRGERRQTLTALGVTILFGIAHLNLAWYLATKLGFGVASSPFATAFYALLGTGIILVAAGLLVLVGAVAKVAGSQLTAFEGEAMRMVSWYWYFAVAAWVAVALTLYPIIKV